MNDPCDNFFHHWEGPMHKLITFSATYGSRKVFQIGDPCDDWSEWF